MSDLKFKFFIFIGFKKIKFSVLDSKNDIFFSKEILIDSQTINENLNSLNKFLNTNIISFEKKLNIYIKDIFLIIDYNDFITLELSTFNNINNNENSIFGNTNYLMNIKNNVEKHMQDYDLIHMIINKYIVEGSKFSSIPKDVANKKIFLEIKFIFLHNKIILDLRKIFSKYQISVNKILSNAYLKRLSNQNESNIFKLASISIDELQENEIYINKKLFKNQGFFEKFFNFFR
tara:strand:- start:429 stop:1127 length:699 start_codon:yes stop_codon:yes gene_type:complete